MQNIFDFNNEDNYLFDSNKIQVLSGEASLIAQQIGAEAEMYLKLDENDGLVAIDSSGNSNHGSFQGGYTENQWVAGKINSAIQGISVNNGFINIDQLIEYERTESFSLECWVKTTSVATMSLISKQLDSGIFTGFTVNCLSGKTRLVIRDNLSNILSIENNTAINDGNWHHIVMTYDGSSQISGCHIYVDNAENDNIISSDILTDTIKNIADLQISGRDGNNLCIDANTAIDEVLIYSRELSPAEVSFRWNNGNGTQIIPGATTSFPTDNPTISPQQNSLKVTEFTSFAATVTASGNDNVFFTILLNNSEKYWNGSAWTDSLGYPEANTFSEINSNLSNLNLTEATILNYKAYLHSDNGTTTPKLSQVIIGYNFELVEPILTEVTVIGNLRDLGEALIGEEFKVRPSWTIGDSTIITGDFIPVITNSIGSFSVLMKIEDVIPTKLEWQIKDKIYLTNFINQTEVKWSDLTIIWQNETEIDFIGN